MSTPSTAGAREKIIDALLQHDRTRAALQEALDVLDGDSVTVPGCGTWNVGRMGQVWALAQGKPGPRTLLRLCTEQPGEWVGFSAVVALAQMTSDQARNELSRFARELNDAGFAERPYEIRQASELGYKTGYRMPTPIAELMARVLEDS